MRFDRRNPARNPVRDSRKGPAIGRQGVIMRAVRLVEHLFHALVPQRAVPGGGGRASAPVPVFAALVCLVCLTLPAQVPAAPGEPEGNAYVGSSRCAECHAKKYKRFVEKSSKARSYRSVELMARKLTQGQIEGCLVCHSTGYGQPGGFRSLEATPELANVGCESCHGPGRLHIVKYSKKLIRRQPDLKTCETCHDASKVTPVRYQGVLCSGAH